MAYRKRLSRGRSRKMFSRGAKRVHKKNYSNPMRGGFRI